MEILWKKESVGELFVDIFKNVPNREDIIGQLSRLFNKNTKDNQLSTEYRKSGNVEFSKKNALAAMDLYNKSLRCAEIGTENVCFAYGNRSACFFELKLYAKCIADIELAKKTKYPDRLLPKLLSRHEQCLELMKKMDTPKSFVPKLSFSAHQKHPGMANVLQIECNEKYGRHITAKSDIAVGKIVLIDEAFVQTKSKMEAGCVSCSKRAMNFIACDHCTGAMFCYKTCGINYHAKVCGIGDRFYSNGMQLIVRSIFLALTIFENIDQLMDFVEEAVVADSKEIPQTLSDEKSRYRAFLKLNIVESSFDNDFLRTAKHLYETISSHTSINCVFETQRKQRFLMHLIYHHYGAVQTNLFNSTDFAHNDHFLLFIKHSYFNHSCASNVIFAIYGNQVICSTARPIKTGEQLFISYSDVHATEAEQHIRQKYFYDNHGFRCECDKCIPQSNRFKISRLINMDPNYVHIVTEVQRDPKIIDRPGGMRDDLKKVCVKLLNKFGNCWNDEVQYISYIFRAIHSIEESQLNSNVTD